MTPASENTRPDQRHEEAVAPIFVVSLLACVVIGSALRLWSLDDPANLFTDEAFSATVAHLPATDIWGFVRASDPHPPLYYFLLKPVEALTTTEWVLRLPSALTSCAALVTVAWWQRRRRFEGLVVTLLFAISAAQIYYGRQVRMYGLMELAGVLAAWSATEWLCDGRRRWIAIATAAGLVAAFSHAAGPLLLVGLALVPGLRRDRQANEWRAAALGGLVLFAAVWGSAMLQWRSSSLYEPVNFELFTVTLNELVVSVPSNRWLQLPLVMAGGIVLIRRRDATGRVWLAIFLLPVLGLAVVALKVPMFIPKSLIMISWGMPLAVGAFVGWAAEQRAVIGATLLSLQLLLVVPFLDDAIFANEHTEEVISALRRDVRDGDIVVAHSVTLVTKWYLVDVDGNTLLPAADVAEQFDRPDTIAIRIGSAPWTHRVWVVDPGVGSPKLAVTGAEECAPPQVLNTVWDVRCYAFDGVRTGSR